MAQKQEPMANPCSKCDYHDRPNFAFCVVDVATDALALLKEQQEQIDRLIEENASNAEMAEGMKELLKEQETKLKGSDDNE